MEFFATPLGAAVFKLAHVALIKVHFKENFKNLVKCIPKEFFGETHT